MRDGDVGEDTHSQPLRVVGGARGEESRQRVVARDDEASEVGEELAAEVEDDEEEVQGGEADGGVGLGDTGLLLKVVEGGVLGELQRRGQYADRVSPDGMRCGGDGICCAYLLVEGAEVLLRLILGGRHDCDGGRRKAKGWEGEESCVRLWAELRVEPDGDVRSGLRGQKMDDDGGEWAGS